MFEQTITTQNPKRSTVSSGRIYLAKPNKFRWETHAPDPSITVSDGLTLWHYTPPFSDEDKGQVVVRKAKETASVAIELLAQPDLLTKSFKIQHEEGSYLRLKPLKPMADIQTIELHLEPSTRFIYKIRLISKLNKETTLVLKQIELNPTIPETLFKFQIPPKTEVIR